MQSLKSERSVLMKDRESIVAACEATRKSLNEKLDAEKVLRGEIRFKDLSAINAAIKDLEDRQSRTSLTLGEEKRVIAEIKVYFSRYALIY
jgi:uncharacterized coiled-coil DUF342 family protein